MQTYKPEKYQNKRAKLKESESSLYKMYRIFNLHFEYKKVHLIPKYTVSTLEKMLICMYCLCGICRFHINRTYWHTSTLQVTHFLHLQW